MKNMFKKFQTVFEKINWVSPLLARLTVGVVFAESGWGKLQNLDQVVEYFASLGIPFATVQAPFVAGLEFVGGILLIIGLITRIISLPLIGVMIVAILTAKLEDLASVTNVFGFSEFLYIVLLAWLVTNGPGLLSFDYYISKKTEVKL